MARKTALALMHPVDNGAGRGVGAGAVLPGGKGFFLNNADRLLGYSPIRSPFLVIWLIYAGWRHRAEARGLMRKNMR